jgi:hypothetical protein
VLKLPQNREVEIEIGTGEVEAMSPGRYASVDRGNLGRPRARVGQSSAPPPAFRSAPPAFRSAPPQAFVPQQVQHYAAAPQAYAQPSYPQAAYAQPSYQPSYAQAAYAQPSYSQPPPPPVPWAPAYASARFTASVPPPPSSLAAIADPTSQYAAIGSNSSRKGSPSGMVWAATLVVMGAFLGAMYGVYMRGPAQATAAAAGGVPAQPVPQVAVQAVAPIGQPVAQPAVAPSFVGVVGPASPVVIPVRQVEEPVVGSTKGKHRAQGRHAAAPAANHPTGGSASVAAAVPVKKPVAAPAAPPAPKGKGKSAEELAAEKTLREAQSQQSL